MRDIFPQKSYTNCSGETIPRPFSEKSTLVVTNSYWKLCGRYLIILITSKRTYL